MQNKPFITVNYATTVAIGTDNNDYELSHSNPTVSLTVDSFNPIVGDIILVKNQADPKENGVYQVTRLNSIAGGVGFSLARICMNVDTICVIFVKSGDTNIRTMWCIDLDDVPYTPGVTEQHYTQIELGGIGMGITDCTIGISQNATYPNLLAAFQDGCKFVRVIDTFTDNSIIPNGTVPSDSMIYVDPGITYTFTGTIDMSDRKLTIRGSGCNSIMEIDNTFTSDSNTVLSILNIKLNLTTSFNDNILQTPYNKLSIVDTEIESLNLTPTVPILVPPPDPGHLIVSETIFIGNSSDFRIVDDTGIIDPHCEIYNCIVRGSCSTSVMSGNGCFELTSSNSHLADIFVESNCSFRIAGKVSNISSTANFLPFDIITGGTILSDSKPLIFVNLSVNNCNLSNLGLFGTFEISGSSNLLSNINSFDSVTISGNNNQIENLLAKSITFSGADNIANNLSVNGSSADLNVGGTNNVVDSAIVGDKTTINGTDCCVSGIVSTDTISIIGANKITNFRALDGFSVAGFPAPIVSNGKVSGTATIGASRASVTDLICDSISVTGVENSLAGINVQSGGSFSISGIRNVVSGGASTPNVSVGGDQCSLSGFYFFSGVTINGDYCSLASCRITSGSLSVSGDNVSITAVNVTSGVTIDGNDCNISSLEMNVSGSLTVNGSGCRIVGSNLLSTTVDVSTATNCIFSGNMFSGLTVNNGGGGVATDPLLVANRLPAIPADIAPVSAANQT